VHALAPQSLSPASPVSSADPSQAAARVRAPVGAYLGSMSPAGAELDEYSSGVRQMAPTVLRVPGTCRRVAPRMTQVRRQLRSPLQAGRPTPPPLLRNGRGERAVRRGHPLAPSPRGNWHAPTLRTHRRNHRGRLRQPRQPIATEDPHATHYRSTAPLSNLALIDQVPRCARPSGACPRSAAGAARILRCPTCVLLLSWERPVLRLTSGPQNALCAIQCLTKCSSPITSTTWIGVRR
jgi:hypothetical protein